MKIKIRPTTEAERMDDFPIANKLEGWYFRIEEKSAGVYIVEGKDLLGRQVSREGIDPNKILAMCINDAKRMKRKQRRPANRGKARSC